jgi:hypothetical protein
MKHLKPILFIALVSLASLYIYKNYIQTSSTSLPQF